jgi:hypothetical protein
MPDWFATYAPSTDQFATWHFGQAVRVRSAQHPRLPGLRGQNVYPRSVRRARCPWAMSTGPIRLAPMSTGLIAVRCRWTGSTGAARFACFTFWFVPKGACRLRDPRPRPLLADPHPDAVRRRVALRGARRSASRIPSMNAATGSIVGRGRSATCRCFGTALPNASRTSRRCTPNLRDSLASSAI